MTYILKPIIPLLTCNTYSIGDSSNIVVVVVFNASNFLAILAIF